MSTPTDAPPAQGHFRGLGARVLRGRGGAIAGVTALSICAGVLASLSLLAVERALRDGPTPEVALLFAACCLGSVLAQALCSVTGTGLTNAIEAGLRTALAEVVVAAPYRRLERYTPADVLATLHHDVGAVSYLFSSMPQLISNVTITAGVVAYLAWGMPWHLFAALLLAVGLSLLLYAVLTRRVGQAFVDYSAGQAALTSHYMELTGGAKELRLLGAVRARFMASLGRTVDAVQAAARSAAAAHAWGMSSGRLMVYVLLGLVLFAYPRLRGAGDVTAASLVLCILYLVGPLDALVHLAPMFGRARVALRKISEMQAVLRPPEPGAERGAAAAAGEPARLQAQEVAFVHEASLFPFGPADFWLAPGELVFLTGANGSGKSTLAKLLCGLYAPEAGRVCVPGAAPGMPAGERVSILFSDFCVLRDMLVPAQPQPPLAQAAWRLLGLEAFVPVLQQADMARLSSGQRKRLAIWLAIQQDREFLIFDEPGVDLDSASRKVFYRELLPLLARHGKGVLVVTHDAEYFDLADRVAMVRDGRIEAAARAGTAAPAGLA